MQWDRLIWAQRAVGAVGGPYGDNENAASSDLLKKNSANKLLLNIRLLKYSLIETISKL